jgi:hypothetical protein
MLRRRGAEHRALDALLRAEGVPLRLRLVCHVHAALHAVMSLVAREPLAGRPPAASRIGEWDARRRDDA